MFTIRRATITISNAAIIPRINRGYPSWRIFCQRAAASGNCSGNALPDNDHRAARCLARQIQTSGSADTPCNDGTRSRLGTWPLYDCVPPSAGRDKSFRADLPGDSLPRIERGPATDLAVRLAPLAPQPCSQEASV